MPSKFAGGPMGIDAWSTFVLRVEHLYTVGKLEKFLDMGGPTFHAKKTLHVTDCNSKLKCMF